MYATNMNRRRKELISSPLEQVYLVWQKCVRILASGTLAIALYGALNTEDHRGMTEGTLPPTASPSVDLGNDSLTNVQEGSNLEKVIVELTSLDQFTALITQGMSTQSYELKIASEELRRQLKEQLERNPFYISTGRVSAPLTPSSLTHFIPKETRVITLFDTQPVLSVYNQRIVTAKLPDEGTLPSETIQTTRVSVQAGITHTTHIITDTQGAITTTARIEGPWQTQAGANTAYALALEQGGLWVSTTPQITILDESNHVFWETSLVLYYTGGQRRGNTIETPYSLKPKYSGDSVFAYHGFVLSSQLAEGVVHKELPQTIILTHDDDVDSTRIADIFTLLGSSQEASLEVYAASSLGDNTSRLRKAWSLLKERAVPREHIKLVSLAAGNDNTVYSDVPNPEQDVFFWVTSLQALRQNEPYYSGSYLASSNVIVESDGVGPVSYAASGCVTTHAVTIDANTIQKPPLTHFTKQQLSCGTSIAAPYLVVEAVAETKQGEDLSVSEVLTDSAALAYRYNASELQSIEEAAVFTDTTLVGLLNRASAQNSIPLNTSLFISAEWKKAEGSYLKGKGVLPVAGVGWDELSTLAEQHGDDFVFVDRTAALSELAQEAHQALSAKVLTFYYRDTQGNKVIIEGSTDRAVRLHLRKSSIRLRLGNIRVHIDRNVSRVAPGSYTSPAQIDEKTGIFSEVRQLLTSFDPAFTQEASPINQLFLPLVISNNP